MKAVTFIAVGIQIYDRYNLRVLSLQWVSTAKNDTVLMMYRMNSVNMIYIYVLFSDYKNTN